MLILPPQGAPTPPYRRGRLGSTLCRVIELGHSWAGGGLLSQSAPESLRGWDFADQSAFRTSLLLWSSESGGRAVSNLSVSRIEAAASAAIVVVVGGAVAAAARGRCGACASRSAPRGCVPRGLAGSRIDVPRQLETLVRSAPRRRSTASSAATAHAHERPTASPPRARVVQESCPAQVCRRSFYFFFSPCFFFASDPWLARAARARGLLQ